LHILSEMISFIDRPILLAPYFLIVQSEELLLLKPIIFTKKQHGSLINRNDRYSAGQVGRFSSTLLVILVSPMRMYNLHSVISTHLYFKRRAPY
jgi:hypothetical protein